LELASRTEEEKVADKEKEKLRKRKQRSDNKKLDKQRRTTA
jgi:hypothetical protein